MLFRKVFMLICALTPLALAQDDSTDGLYADFPLECKQTCDAMEGIISKCSMIGESAPEAETVACVCNDDFVKSVQDCGSCVIPAAGLASESGNTISQIAISVSQHCGRPVSIAGVTDPELSSALASPSGSFGGSFATASSSASASSISPLSSTSTSGSSSTSSTTAAPTSGTTRDTNDGGIIKSSHIGSAVISVLLAIALR
ncbi:uncharacterized protein JCM15063_001446 [Sporobolomyces koalae]|uniref:uncharacterized protein n=1 Tax=Sporobolomyces koalae TaxID=500713 RepID=UPI00317AC98A